MKTITKLTTLFVLLLITSSCLFDGFTGIKGNEYVITEERSLNDDFNAIKVSQGITLFLTQDNEESLTVEADENIMEILITEVTDDVLKIYFKENVYRAKARNVYLSTNNIESIKASSGAEVRSENTLNTSSLSLKSSSGSSMRLLVNANEVQCSSSSGADIRIKGETSTLSTNASSGSHIDADELISANTTARASSGANINVYASDNLNASASSGGNIDYKGSPKTIDKDTSSGGSVSGS